jgi:hypothetical protein
MQYSKGRANPIAVGEGTETLLRATPRLLPKRAASVVFALPLLILAGCSDSLTGAAPSPPSFANSTKALGKTLTPEQQRAAIADLQNAQASRQGAADTTTTASVKPSPAGN